MTEQSDTSTSEGDLKPITVRQLKKVQQITAQKLKRAVQATARNIPIRTVSVAIVDDATIASLHKKYLNDDRTTDVLAFDLRDDPNDNAIEGEIVVSAETAHHQADRLGLTVSEEVLRYVIHGMLHLLGYRDKTAAQRRQMRLQEDRILADLSNKTKATPKRRRP